MNYSPNGLIDAPRVFWGARSPKRRGPLVCYDAGNFKRNIIGAPGGPNIVYSAVSEAIGQRPVAYRPNYDYTDSAIKVPPRDAWFRPNAIVSLDPLGYEAHRTFGEYVDAGADIRPSISITPAKLDLPDIRHAINTGALDRDGLVVQDDGQINVTKISIDPVWYLPGIAARFDIEEDHLRETLVRATNGMHPELVTRPDLKVYLPPISGITVYLFGDIDRLRDPATKITTRPHDECNGSDVFGADICTCRPYLMQGIMASARAAQEGGLGLIVYNRKEGRALGEVVKLLVYNARFGQPGGDNPGEYFNRTREVAGVVDARAQPLMPDVYKWLGIARIDMLVSMSNVKYDAIRAAGIAVVQRKEMPPDTIPLGAKTEITAKIASGYFFPETCLSDLKQHLALG